MFFAILILTDRSTGEAAFSARKRTADAEHRIRYVMRQVAEAPLWA
jgi:hypothetical protein